MSTALSAVHNHTANTPATARGSKAPATPATKTPAKSPAKTTSKTPAKAPAYTKVFANALITEARKDDRIVGIDNMKLG